MSNDWMMMAFMIQQQIAQQQAAEARAAAERQAQADGAAQTKAAQDAENQKQQMAAAQRYNSWQTQLATAQAANQKQQAAAGAGGGPGAPTDAWSPSTSGAYGNAPISGVGYGDNASQAAGRNVQNADGVFGKSALGQMFGAATKPQQQPPGGMGGFDFPQKQNGAQQTGKWQSGAGGGGGSGFRMF